MTTSTSTTSKLNIELKKRGYTKLSHRVAIVVPSTININQTIDNTEYINKVASLFSNWFGGATATDNKGFWMSDTEGLVKENSTFVYANCTEIDMNNRVVEIFDLAESIKAELHQDSVAVEFDGMLILI